MANRARRSTASQSVPAVVESVPPLTAMFPDVVTLPVRVDAPSTVSVPLDWIFPVFDIVVPLDP